MITTLLAVLATQIPTVASESQSYGWRDLAGPSIQIRHFPDSKIVAIHLVASASVAPETPRTHGWRHLLEHLLVRGQDRRLDTRLEAEGCALTAQTYRDFTHIRLVGPPDKTTVLLDALKEVLRPLQTDAKDIAAETEIIAEEMALEGEKTEFSAALWQAAFKNEGLDPYGDLANMRQTTPDQLEGLRQKLFSGDNLALVVCVPKDVMPWADRIRKNVLWRAGTAKRAEVVRTPQSPSRVQLDHAFGEYRAASIPGLGTAGSLGTLVAAFGVASLADSPVFIYTPSMLPGLVIVGQTQRNNGLGLAIDSLSPAKVRSLYPLAVAIARGWVESGLRDPAVAGLWLGMSAAERKPGFIESLPNRISEVTFPEFQKGLANFKSDSAFVAVGVGL